MRAHTAFRVLNLNKPRKNRDKWLRYGSAVGLTLLALAVGLVLQTIVGHRIPLFFFAASSLIAAWWGGFGPGFLALTLGLFLGDFFFIPPLFALGAYSPSDLVMLLLYVSVTGIGLGAMTHLHHALEREADAKKVNQELERRVKERTSELESFCYSVSHDLRAPIRSVIAFTELIREGYEPCLDDEGKKMLQIVIQSSYRFVDAFP